MYNQKYRDPARLLVLSAASIDRAGMLREHVAQHPTWNYLAASEILSRAVRYVDHERKNRSIDRGHSHESSINLIDAIHLLSNDKNLLIDAENANEGGSDNLLAPPAAILRLEPSGVLCIWDNVANIHNKLSCKGPGAECALSVQQLDKEQNDVFATCQMYRARLGVQVFFIRSGEKRALHDVLTYQERR